MFKRTDFGFTLVLLATLTLLPGCEFFQQLGPYDEVPLTVTVANDVDDSTVAYRIVVAGPFSGTFNLRGGDPSGESGSMRGNTRSGGVFRVTATATAGGENNASGECTFDRASMRALRISLAFGRHSDAVEVFCYGF